MSINQENLLINELLTLYKHKLYEKNLKYEEFLDLNKDVNILQQQIYKKCNHEWIRDYQTVSYDRIPYICSICDLSD
jgi:hypothetical protein